MRLEVKILEHHYTHLLFDLSDGSQIAVEIGTRQLSANRIDSLSDEYSKKGIAVKWIVIGNIDATVRENQTYFLKRYLLNESKNKDLLVVNCDGEEVAQYKADPNKYEYRGDILSSNNYPETYCECASLTELAIDDGEFTLSGFHERYSNWLIKKRRAFGKKIKQLEEDRKRYLEAVQQQVHKQNRLYQERQAWLKHNQAYPPVKITSGLPICTAQGFALLSNTSSTYCQRRDEILPQIDQQQFPTCDSSGRRWVKCEKCGCVETDEKFVSYGGQNHVNLGICRDCSGIKCSPKV